MEADDVVGQQPLVELVADAVGQHAPRVRLRPRDVHEVVQEDVRPRAADDRRQRVQVVVVHHHDGLLDPVDLLDDRLGEVVVDHLVAVVEGLDLAAPHVRGVGEVPEVVLDEPQHRVGDDVVEAVVGLGIGGDEPHLVLAARRGADPDRAAVGLAGAHGVHRRHRRGDPGDLAVRGQTGERRDEPAGPALHRSVLLEGDRAAVGDQDEGGGLWLGVTARRTLPAAHAAKRRRTPRGRRPDQPWRGTFSGRSPSLTRTWRRSPPR